MRQEDRKDKKTKRILGKVGRGRLRNRGHVETRKTECTRWSQGPFLAIHETCVTLKTLLTWKLKMSLSRRSSAGP